MAPELAKFMAGLVLKLVPGPGVIGWIKNAIDFVIAVQKRWSDLEKTFNSLKSIFGNVVGDKGSARDLGVQFSELVQSNLPIVFSVLATALGFEGVAQKPAAVIKNFKAKLEVPAPLFPQPLAGILPR